MDTEAKICLTKFRIWLQNFFRGLNQKLASEIILKFSFESISKIASKNLEKLIEFFFNFNEINNVYIANLDTGNFVHFGGRSVCLSIHI